MKLWIMLIVTSALQTTIVNTGTLGPKESGELSQNRPRCDEKRGRCIPIDSPCRGRAMICCDYCRDEDNYKCCIDMCYTYKPCSSLGGKCLNQHEECDGIGVNVENGCSVENSLNCTCCVPHSKKDSIKDWEKANEKTSTFAKESNQISPYNKKHSRTGKDLPSETMDELEDKLINEKDFLMEQRGNLMDDLVSEEETIADEDIIGSNEFSVDENESLEYEKGLINDENAFGLEEKELEDENNGPINNNDDLSSEVEEIIAENDDFYESIEEKDGENDILEENVDNNIDVKDDENSAVDSNEDYMLKSSNEDLDNDYSFTEDENENNEGYSDDKVNEDVDNIEYDDYEYDNKNEDKKDDDENEGNTSTEADEALEYEED